MQGKSLFFLWPSLLFCTSFSLNAQMENLHGDQNYSYRGLLSGNQIRTTIYNDGKIGERSDSPDDIGGEWPIESGHNYIPRRDVK